MELVIVSGRAEAVLAARIAGVATGTRPLLVALDGRSGAGKSTVAAAVRSQLGAALIDGDSFYSGGTAAEWDAMGPAEKVGHCIDWRRQRPVLEALAAGEPATWLPYDWEAADGRPATTPITCRPEPVVVLDGVYGGRPELSDLFDLRVMLDVPDHVRHRRLRHREGDGDHAEWERRWAEAERHYFTFVMPPDAFDLVLRAVD